MDPIMMKKIQDPFKKSKKNQFLGNFCLYSLTAIICSLFFSSPFWLPSLFSALKVFFFIYFPKISSVLFSPKLSFLVANLIVVILVGGSKFLSSNISSSSDVYYDEYVDKSQGHNKVSGHENVKKRSGDHGYKFVTVEKEKEDLGAEDAGAAMPMDELNKRADDFIARVNRIRMLEAKFYA